MNPVPLNARGSDASGMPHGSPKGRLADPPKVSLQLSGPLGFRYTAEMHGTSCDIGSAPASQIVIPHLGLADRHAIVTNVGGALTVTACPSAPVSVNGKEVKGTVRLKDGDNIGLGPKLSATVRISHGLAQTPAAPVSAQSLWPRVREYAYGYTARLGERRLVMLVLAALFGVVLLSALWSRLGGVSPADETQATLSRDEVQTVGETVRGGEDTAAIVATTPQPPPDESAASTPADTSASSVYEKKVKVAVKNVMRRIASGDATPYIDDSVVADVMSQIDAYRADADVLRSLQAERSQLSAAAFLARREDVEPSLLVLTALLEMTEHRRQAREDVAATARNVLQRLKNLSIILNSKDADSCLIVVAAQYEVENGRREADLLKSLRMNVRDSRHERNFKVLYDRGGISRGAYEHVIKFLALGALALEPQTLGVEGEPPSF